MKVLIVDGEYKGCETITFTKGVVHYFKGASDNRDIRLNNHLYIQKDGCLNDVVYLLNIAWGSDNLEFFLKTIEKDMDKIKEPHLLRKGRIEKFYSNKVEIEHKFLEILKEKKEEQITYNCLLSFVQDIQEEVKKEKLTYPLVKNIDDSNKYGEIFNSESPDVDMMDLLKQSAKSGKPFVVIVPEDMLSEPSNVFLAIANDTIKRALQDDDCDSVNVVYLKQK